MTYLIMKLHMAYAVALDNRGRFVKVANIGYKVGQKVTDVILLDDRSASSRSSVLKRITLFAAIAASFLIIAVSIWQLNFVTYGYINLKINPEVSMGVSRTRKVLKLEGLNSDGIALIEGYKYRGLSQTKVTDDLVDRAIEHGYLSDGGKITLTILSDNLSWRKTTSKILGEDLQKHLVDKDISVFFESAFEDIEDIKDKETASIIIEIPIKKNIISDSEKDDDMGISDYGISDDDGDSLYDNSDDDNGDSLYDDSGDVFGADDEDILYGDFDDDDSTDDDDVDNLNGDSDYDDT